MSERVVQNAKRQQWSDIRLAMTLSVAVLLLVAAAAVYYRASWDRMEVACSVSNEKVSFGWSWLPPGFKCTYPDGRTETSLWF
jgi:hypothetical protein